MNILFNQEKDLRWQWEIVSTDCVKVPWEFDLNVNIILVVLLTKHKEVNNITTQIEYQTIL